MRRLLGLAFGVGLLAGCLGENQLAGSVSGLFPLEVSNVEIMRNQEALVVNYYRNNGANVDLVVGVSVYVADLNFVPGGDFPLDGQYAPDHDRCTVIHQGAGEPVRILGAIKHGDLKLDRGGSPGDLTQGNFSLSFYQGPEYAAGRGLQGTFQAPALDGGFGPPNG